MLYGSFTVFGAGMRIDRITASITNFSRRKSRRIVMNIYVNNSKRRVFVGSIAIVPHITREGRTEWMYRANWTYEGAGKEWIGTLKSGDSVCVQIATPDYRRSVRTVRGEPLTKTACIRIVR